MSRRLTACFLVTLFLFVLARGLGLASALMPFEGWDEYQHLAVAEFVSVEGRMPVILDKMPATMTPFLVAHPHPDSSAEQLKSIGAPRYRGQPVPGAEAPPRLPELYQAQHGPVYYHALASLRSLVADRGAWADLARTINVVLLALTGVIWFWIVARTFPTFPVLPFAAALIWSAGSVWVFNAARVANDTAAIFLGSVAIAAFVAWRGGARRIGWLVAIGAIVGLGAITKSTILAVAPVLALAAMTSVKGWRSSFVAGVAFAAGYSAVAGYYHLDCLTRYGTITGMLEGVRNRHLRGIQLEHVVVQAVHLDYRAMFNKFLLDVVHVGGWSFLRAPIRAIHAHQWLLGIAAVGHVTAIVLRRGSLRAIGRSWWSVLLVAAVWCGMLYHAAHSMIDRGEIYTNAWYGALVFPVVAALSMLGLVAVSSRLGAIVAIVWSAVLSVAFVIGVYRDLLPHQTGASTLSDGAEIVASHHAFLTVPAWPALFVQGALWLILVALAWRATLTTRAAAVQTGARRGE